MLDFHTGVWALRRFDANPIARVSPAKRLCDLVGAAALLIPLVFFMLLLVAINPFLNKGPVWYRQDRMGFACRPFAAFKFRTMSGAHGRGRGAFDPLETERITPLGRILRITHIDELPQIINVLRGEMSLIGPRPDSYDHALIYLRTVPGYRDRHSILPGISGLAQTEVGYVDGIDDIRRKVAADLHYVATATLGLDLWIAWRTIVVVLARRGA